MRCAICQSDNPEDKKFCGECGGALPQPEQTPEEQPVVAMSTAPRPMWLSAHWKGLVAVAVVLIVVLAAVGLIYTQPLSKIKVIVSSEYGNEVQVNIYIDGQLKVAMDLEQGTTIVGVWPVDAGSHVVALDHGTWDIYRYSSSIYYYPNSYEDPDGTMDYAYEYSVGPLYTKNVYIYITLPP